MYNFKVEFLSYSNKSFFLVERAPGSLTVARLNIVERENTSLINNRSFLKCMYLKFQTQCYMGQKMQK